MKRLPTLLLTGLLAASSPAALAAAAVPEPAPEPESIAAPQWPVGATWE